MRYVGIFIMVSAAVGAGFWAAESVKERLDILLLIRQMVYHLKSRILYANATLPEALCEIGSRFSRDRIGIQKEPGVFFCRVYEGMEANRERTFSEIWKSEVGRIPKDVPLTHGDRESLASLGENLGYADREMQERTLLFYLEQVDDTIAGLKQEVETRGKLYRSLGVAAGLFLVIILV